MILSAYTELGRAISHFKEYFIYNEDGDATMSNKTVDLTKIDFTAEADKSKWAQQMIILTLTTAKELDTNCFTKALLMEHINAMLCVMLRRIRVRVDASTYLNQYQKNASKPGIIEYLVKWRSEVFKKNPTMKSTLEEAIKRTFCR
jgi:hypothetical protein